MSAGGREQSMPAVANTDGGQGASYVALCGGIGGAKLALGLAHSLSANQLTVIVNTGDDFEHMGLYISPDIDTVLYTLSGLANPETGWGLEDETWSFMSALERLGGPDWFKLGDGDLAMHVDRTHSLRRGETLSEITDRTRRRLAIRPRIVPMSDQPVRAIVVTDEGELPFQDYFVRRQCAPRVCEILFEGAAEARLAPAARTALNAPDLGGIILCPSNPWLSIDPILAVPKVKSTLRESNTPVIAVTPLIAGKAVKGPTAKIMGELGLQPDIRTIINHYQGLIDGFILDRKDEEFADKISLPVLVTNTFMQSLEDRICLAEESVDFCRSLCENMARSLETEA